MKAKKLTKILAFSMSMMMMLTGCGGGAKETASDATPGQSTETKVEESAETSTETSTEAPAEEAKELSKTEQAKAELDFGGGNNRILLPTRIWFDQYRWDFCGISAS